MTNDGMEILRRLADLADEYDSNPRTRDYPDKFAGWTCGDARVTLGDLRRARAIVAQADRKEVMPPEHSSRAQLDTASPTAGPIPEAGAPFQTRVKPWLIACFGEAIAADPVERNHRFLEEAIELVQSLGCSQAEAHQLVDYVYGRPAGDAHQETGGVMVTLAALCLANGLDMHAAGETELARIWGAVEKIRAKQAAKPRNSPLPGPSPQPPAPAEAPDVTGLVETLRVGTLTGYGDGVMREAADALTAQAAEIERLWARAARMAEAHAAALAAKEAEIARIRKAVEKIAAVENMPDGEDWLELSRARDFARAALAGKDSQ